MEVNIKQVSEITGIRQPVIEFALLMEKKLKENDHKGGWKECEQDWLLKRTKQELKELEHKLDWRKVDTGRSAGEGVQFVDVSDEATARECADVANFVMMICDNLGSGWKSEINK